MPACFTKPIRRLLTHKWQLASLVAALIAVASLIPKWYGYPEPEPHRSILLIHDLSIATGLGCAILAYYFAPRKTIAPRPPRPEDGLDGDEWTEIH